MENIVKKNEPEAIYKENIASFDHQTQGLKKRDMILGVLKLLWVIAAVLSLFDVFPMSVGLTVGLFTLFLCLFILTAILHENVIAQQKVLHTKRAINEKELGFLEYRFPVGADTGQEFQNGSHNYSSDMDIFGEKGIFHYINRAVTAMGKQCLAENLQTPATATEIIQRQEAVQELAQQVNLRQTITAHGMFIDDSSAKLDGLHRFLQEPYTLWGKRGIRFLLVVLPSITLGAAILIAFKIPYILFLALVLVQVAVNKKYFNSISRLYKLTTKSHKILKAYSRIMAEIEKETFSSPLLKHVQQELSAHLDGVEQKAASVCIQRLSTLLDYFDSRRGMFHFLPANTVLWDLFCMYYIEKWRAQCAPHVQRWFAAIGEFEMLASLAAVQYNNPGWTMPRITQQPFRLLATAMGHPLIPPQERICNDVNLSAAAQSTENSGCMMVVTGPNMAGKSTFLRSVGVNIVLALAGGPVCATAFEITPVKLYTSMLASDSLDKHLSLFYAELQRLKMILDGIASGEPVFFMIDEMLKGTNALDRQKGAIALLKQLEKHHANGIVATHDLELTKLSNANYHFDGYIEEDKLLFDYRLKTGTCQSFNALVLMKNMGIDVS